MDGEASAFRRPRPVTLHELVHQVASCDWSRRQGVTHEAVAAVWGALCDVIAASLAAGTGVKLPGLGSFWPAPAFVVLRTLRTVRGGIPNESAPIVPLNFFSVARLAGVRREWATPLIRLLLEALAGHVSGHAAMDVDFGVGSLVCGDGVFAFTFSDAFLARCGVVPPASRASSRAGARRRAHTPLPPPPAPPSDAHSVLLATCASLDTHRSGLLPRLTMEHVLRTVGASVIADVDAIALLGMLDAASERAGRAVAYARLLAMLSGASAAAPAEAPPASPAPALRPSALSAALSPPARQAEPAELSLPAPSVRLVRLTDAFASRKSVEEYNRARAAALAEERAAEVAAASASARGVTPKIGVRPAVLQPGTPGAQAEACPLAARKHAEAEADRERVLRVRATLAAEQQEAARRRAEQQRALRAALDEQVAARRYADMQLAARAH